MTPQRKLYWPKNDFVLCTGWFSRLILLSTTVGCILFWLAGMLISIVTVWKQPKPTFVVSDVIAVESEKTLFMRGISNYPIAGKINTLMSTTSGSCNPQMAWQSIRNKCIRVFPRVGKVNSGFYRVLIKGTPFGPFAYDHQEASTLVVSEFQPLYLINAQDVLRWETNSQLQLHQMIRLLQKRGKIVFVHPGTPTDYENTRDELLKLFPEIPCVCDLTLESGMNRTLNYIAWMLKWAKRTSDNTPVVTAISSDSEFITTAHQDFDLGKSRYINSIIVGNKKTDISTPLDSTSSSLRREHFRNLKTTINSLQN